MARTALAPRFPDLALSGGGYESFYLRAVDPDRPRGVWLRHTVHKVPGEPPVGSVWATIFDRDAAGPAATKHSVAGPSAPAGEWLRVGESAIGPDGVHGSAGEASHDLAWEVQDAVALRHLPREWMYRTALPRTKSESPLPDLRLSGRMRVGDTEVELDGWPGMLGHNWGDQHAERWIWLHGTAFEDAPDTWLDLVIGRVRIGPLTTPWIANGVLSAGGRRTRFGGRSAQLRETPVGVDLVLRGAGGARLELTARSPREQIVVWRYADPDGSEHHTANCSVASVDAVLHPRGGAPLRLHTGHGGVYELGMRETDHGLPVLGFSDP